MNSGKMFASLLEYKNQEYYEAHREMYLYTPDQIYKLEVFSAYVDNVEGNYYQMSFEDEEDYLSFFNAVSYTHLDSFLCLYGFPKPYNPSRPSRPLAPRTL